MGIVLFAIGWALGFYLMDDGLAGMFIAGVVYLFMNLITFFQGDNILLTMAGARKITKQDNPRLYNVVEEMQIASGLPKLPDIYIIDDPAMNAFATGRNPDHAAVAITSGLLEKLNRDELQGVLAHELAHIKNRDSLLMLNASVMVGSIVLLSYFGSRMLIFGGGRRRSSNDSGAGMVQLIIMVVSLVLMILAPIIAQLIYFAISRKREYLADASSALYTRYPEGLASALEKLGSHQVNVKAANQATAPMYIVNPFRKPTQSLDSLMATHPPLASRIKILRGMSGVSFNEYEQAYEQVTHHKGVIPKSVQSLAGGEAPTQRAASSEGSLADGMSRVERHKETSDMLYKMNNYRTIQCGSCGTVMRIPPGFRAPAVRCPHCGEVSALE